MSSSVKNHASVSNSAPVAAADTRGPRTFVRDRHLEGDDPLTVTVRQTRTKNVMDPTGILNPGKGF